MIIITIITTVIIAHYFFINISIVFSAFIFASPSTKIIITIIIVSYHFQTTKRNFSLCLNDETIKIKTLYYP